MSCIVIKIGVGTGGKTSHREGVNTYVLIPMLSGGGPCCLVYFKQANKQTHVTNERMHGTMVKSIINQGLLCRVSRSYCVMGQRL